MQVDEAPVAEDLIINPEHSAIIALNENPDDDGDPFMAPISELVLPQACVPVQRLV